VSVSSRIAAVAPAFRHRNYRLFFAGQSTSLIGTWMTRIATSWLVYRLSGSAFQLGLVNFAGQIPTMLVTAFAGVLVDRWDRQRILVVTQVLSMLQSAALAVLTLAGVITVPEIIGLQVFQGLINAFDTPARQAFVVQMVDDRNDLANAIAYNSSMVNGSRIIGPSIAGILIALVGEGWCFAIDALSYVAVIVSLLAMRVTRGSRPGRRSRMLEELRTGFGYVTGSPALWTPLLLLAIVSMVGIPYAVLMPAMATDVLHGGPNTYGMLATASGTGALIGGLYLATRPSILGLGRIISFSTLAFGVGLVGFGLSGNLWLSLAALPIVGAGFMIQMTATNTVLQTIVDEEFRGRVMAYYTMAFFGASPIGSLVAGVVADRIGAPATIAVGGLACGGAALWFWLQLPKLRAIVRPIYVQRGIISVPGVEGIPIEAGPSQP
jgi:MFS family permease